MRLGRVELLRRTWLAGEQRHRDGAVHDMLVVAEVLVEALAKRFLLRADQHNREIVREKVREKKNERKKEKRKERKTRVVVAF